MTFFNQKEEVLQIELTQYGKHLLSRGKLKPIYYAFYDDDIIYDGKYAGIEENNGTAVERIKSAVRPKTQYVFTGIEAQIKKNVELIKSGKETLDSLRLVPTADKHHVLNKRIGTSFLGDQNYASLNVAVLKGEIESTTLYQVGSITDIPVQKTPLFQLKDSDFFIRAERVGTETPEVEGKTYINQYPDGTAISLTDNYLLIEMFEKNVENDIKNFDIEIFMCETNEETQEETYIPLHFDQKYENYKNGILLDPQERNNETEMFLSEQKNVDPLRVENYFNILTDTEIDKNLICKLINNMKQNVNLYDPVFDCSDYQEQVSVSQSDQQDLYSPSFNEDDIDRC